MTTPTARDGWCMLLIAGGAWMYGGVFELLIPCSSLLGAVLATIGYVMVQRIDTRDFERRHGLRKD